MKWVKMTSPFLSPTFIGETLLKSPEKFGAKAVQAQQDLTGARHRVSGWSRRFLGGFLERGDFSQKRGIFLSHPQHPQHPTFATIRKRRSCGHDMQKFIGRNLVSMVDEMKPDIPNPILLVTLQLNKKWPG